MTAPATIRPESIEAVARTIQARENCTPEVARRKAERWAKKKAKPAPAPYSVAAELKAARERREAMTPDELAADRRERLHSPVKLRLRGGGFYNGGT